MSGPSGGHHPPPANQTVYRSCGLSGSNEADTTIYQSVNAGNDAASINSADFIVGIGGSPNFANSTMIQPFAAADLSISRSRGNSLGNLRSDALEGFRNAFRGRVQEDIAPHRRSALWELRRDARE